MVEIAAGKHSSMLRQLSVGKLKCNPWNSLFLPFSHKTKPTNIHKLKGQATETGVGKINRLLACISHRLELQDLCILVPSCAHLLLSVHVVSLSPLEVFTYFTLKDHPT